MTEKVNSIFYKFSEDFADDCKLRYQNIIIHEKLQWFLFELLCCLGCEVEDSNTNLNLWEVFNCKIVKERSILDFLSKEKRDHFSFLEKTCSIKKMIFLKEVGSFVPILVGKLKKSQNPREEKQKFFAIVMEAHFGNATKEEIVASFIVHCFYKFKLFL